MIKAITISACAGLLLAGGMVPAAVALDAAPAIVLDAAEELSVEPAQVRWFERRDRSDTPSEGGAFLGVTLQNLDEALRAAFEFEGPGVLVNSIVDDSPADDARLRTGDIITHFDGQEVDSPDQLRDAIVAHGVGAAELEFIRRGRSRTVEVDLRTRKKVKVFEFKDWSEDEHPGHGDRHFDMREHGEHQGGHERHFKEHRERGKRGDDDGVMRRERVRIFHPGTFLGVRLETLSDDLADYFGVAEGVLVVDIVDDSPAEEAGIRAGDVITHFDGDAVGTPSELRAAVQAKDTGDRVRLRLVRKGDERRITVELAQQGSSKILEHLGNLELGDVGEHLAKLQEQLKDKQFKVEIKDFDDLRERMDEPPVDMDARLERLEEMLERLGEELEKLAERLDRRFERQ